MAVQNHLTNYDPTAEPVSAVLNTGTRKHHAQNTVGILDTDSDTSTYMLLRKVNAYARLDSLELEHDSITGGTDFDIGFYDSDTGAEVDKDVLADGISLATAATKVAPRDGMPAVTHANTLKPIYELLGKTKETTKPFYDLVLTGNTVGTASGSVTARVGLAPAG